MPVLDIASNQPGPAGILSNFHPSAFVFMGVEVASMEGFLQSLKFSFGPDQRLICKSVGLEAKLAGRNRWHGLSQPLVWQEEGYHRLSSRYHELLLSAYCEMFKQNEESRTALQQTDGYLLTHSIGCKDPNKTVLTSMEFCAILMAIRDYPAVKVSVGLQHKLAAVGWGYF